MKSLKLIAASAVLLTITALHSAEQNMSDSFEQQMEEWHAAQARNRATIRPVISIEPGANKDNLLAKCPALKEIAKFLSLKDILSAQYACHKLRKKLWDPNRTIVFKCRHKSLDKRYNEKYQCFVKYTQARDAHNPIKLNLEFRKLTDMPDIIGILGDRLISVDLSNTKYSQPALEKLFGLCIHIQELNLSGHHPINLPENVGELKDLRSVSLWGRRNIQPALEKLFRLCPHIQELKIASGALADLPDSTSMLDHLRSVSLSGDRNLQLANLKKLFVLCTHIQELNLSGCNLTKLPDGIGILRYHLRSLNLYNNPDIQPALDKLFRLCPYIQDLDLSYCKIIEIPGTIALLREHLLSLNLVGNNLDDAEKERIRALLPNTQIYF